MKVLFPCLLALSLLGASAGIAAEPAATAAPAPAATPFAFQANDRIAFIGSTLIEREMEQSNIETALTALHPGLNLRFRNLGWSGDTVWGQSRSYFDEPAKGLERLSGHLGQIKPSVLFVSYGAVEAWNGPGKLDEFVKAYEAFLDRAAKASGGSPRVILLAPMDAEPQPAPKPPVDLYNKNLAKYREVIAALAQRRGATYVDLNAAIRRQAPIVGQPALTSDGYALSPSGYLVAAKAISTALNCPGAAQPAFWTNFNVPNGPIAGMRAKIQEKNRLFFHRWRPQNETYLFGFRKHEQGNNGAEIPLFDPLIEAREKEIAEAPKGPTS